MSDGVDAALGNVRLLALDVDGVLTDGQILLTEGGEEIKAFYARDGIALKCWHLAGHASAIITARGSAAVKRRAEELGIGDVILNAQDKRASLAELCRRRGLSLDQVAFMGDDLQDLGAMLSAGVSITVAGCPPELAHRATFVTDAPGGRGAVREAVERILKTQSRWQDCVSHFLP